MGNAWEHDVTRSLSEQDDDAIWIRSHVRFFWVAWSGSGYEATPSMLVLKQGPGAMSGFLRDNAQRWPSICVSYSKSVPISSSTCPGAGRDLCVREAIFRRIGPVLTPTHHEMPHFIASRNRDARKGVAGLATASSFLPRRVLQRVNHEHRLIHLPQRSDASQDEVRVRKAIDLVGAGTEASRRGAGALTTHAVTARPLAFLKSLGKLSELELYETTPAKRHTSSCYRDAFFPKWFHLSEVHAALDELVWLGSKLRHRGSLILHAMSVLAFGGMEKEPAEAFTLVAAEVKYGAFGGLRIDDPTMSAAKQAFSLEMWATSNRTELTGRIAEFLVGIQSGARWWGNRPGWWLGATGRSRWGLGGADVATGVCQGDGDAVTVETVVSVAGPSSALWGLGQVQPLQARPVRQLARRGGAAAPL
eukprot:ctg_204.g152